MARRLHPFLRIPFLLIAVLLGLTIAQSARASAPGCGQAHVESLLGAPVPPGASTTYIVPNATVAPFYQWESNNGYCGEVSLMSAGLAAGQWLSQYNARMVCGGYFGPEANGSGPSLLQAGRPSGRNGNYNAELLIENPAQGLSGPYDYDWAARCAANSALSLIQYPATTGYRQPDNGLAGYRDFMSWIKSQIIAGHQVTLGVLLNTQAGGSDAQYDHIVNVVRIGTNHSPTDASYYSDDVLYFDDHGVYTLKVNAKGVWSFTTNPSIPPGAGSDTKGCTPYLFAYTFASLVKTRRQENAPGAPAYAVVLPDTDTKVKTNTGNAAANGDGTTTVVGPHNAAFAITGPVDAQGETKPVTLAILGTSTRTRGQWVRNPPDQNSSPAAGFNYENPYIGGPPGTCNDDNCISNTQPAAMRMTLQATVQDLTPGVAYNLYEYDFPTQTGARTGNAAALAIPTGDFNAQSGLASAVTPFVAQGSTYATPALARMSNEIVVFRAVPASAP
jgi:hypothetical protein